MRFSQPTTSGSELLPYSSLKIEGCSDTTIGFEFVSGQSETGRRRYCNKVLVHECLTVIEPDPIELEKVEFLATDDPAYRYFNIFKSSEIVDGVNPAITIQLNELGEAIGVIIFFDRDDLCCSPLKMAYRMYGYLPSESGDENNTNDRILLSQGNLYVTFCPCNEVDGTLPNEGGPLWSGLNW